MKLTITLFCLTLSFFCSAQIINGIYMGRLTNDSSKKNQTYELALSEYRGKVTGYAYTTFVSNDTFYYSIKRIKATRNDSMLIVEDDKMIINNYPERVAKGVHQINYIRLNKNEDTLSQATGRWETTRTKIYYAIKGSMETLRNTDSSKSALVAHLKELNLIPNDRYQQTVVVKEKENKTKIKSSSPLVKEAPLPPLPYDQRKNKQMQVIEVVSDSIALAFYDNGVIDGDSVSVYFNQNNVVRNLRLAASASKKTIVLSSQIENSLLLVAENLGSLPPNTGLLVIRDGENTYQVNFSADMQTNAEIIIRRKKK